MSEQSSSDIEQNGLIWLKCRGCKEPFLTDLSICHEADGQKHRAQAFCVRCVAEKPLRKLVMRELVSKLVEAQRADPNCYEADCTVSPATEQEEDNA